MDALPSSDRNVEEGHEIDGSMVDNLYVVNDDVKGDVDLESEAPYGPDELPNADG